jgi:hypothetical protein
MGAFQGFVDLWVVNVTKAAAGTVTCDGSDANCLRLTTNLFVVNATDPTKIDLAQHSFQGDTLIYRAETGPTFDQNNPNFVGPIYAWRPGWEGGRALTSDSGRSCAGHAKAQVAICFDNKTYRGPTGQTCTFSDATTDCQVLYDLHAGALPAAAGAAPLPKIDTLLLQSNQDMGAPEFGVQLSPDGTSVAWSGRATTTGPEVLKVQKLGDPAPTTVATDVSVWQISSDNMRWYWLSKYSYNATVPIGTLQAAPFPGGASPTTLGMGVVQYFDAGTKSLIFFDTVVQGRATLKMIADRDAPAGVVTLDTGVAGELAVSADGTKVAYFKAGVADPSTGALAESDLYVGTSAGTHCTLSPTQTAFPFAEFFPSGANIVWSKLDSTGFPSDGLYADAATCTSTKFASNIFLWAPPIGDQGLVFGDDGTTAGEVTIRYSKVSGGALPMMGTSVQTRAYPLFATLTPTLPAVVYNVLGGTSADGLYVNASLPF